MIISSAQKKLKKCNSDSVRCDKKQYIMQLHAVILISHTNHFDLSRFDFNVNNSLLITIVETEKEEKITF